jgi:pilus assembly protein CpaB
VLGKCALVNLAVGDYILPSKVGNDLNNAQSILGSLDSEHKAISISIASYALGFSGKLETGDIISILVYDEVENLTYTPKELNYVKVITTTTSNGVDKENVEDTSQPVTVTLLVNAEQAELLAFYEKVAEMHIVLEYRGDNETAQKYLDVQNKVFGGK